MGVRGDVLPAGRQHERDGAGEVDQQVRKQKNERYKTKIFQLQLLARGEAVPGVDARRQPRREPGGRQQSRHLRRELEPLPRHPGRLQGLQVRVIQ